MKSANWKEIAELLGIAAIVASLVFVGLQMKQEQELAYAEAMQSIYANNLERKDQMNQHMAVWLKGNSGAELAAVELEIYRNLLKTRHDEAFFITVTLPRTGEEDVNFAVNELAGFLFRNRGARREWNIYRAQIIADRRSLGGDDLATDSAFAAAVSSRLEMLDAADD